MTGIRSLRCRTAHRWLAAAHDGELPVARQLALDAHLNACAECLRVRQELRAVSVALREYATEHRPNETDCAGVESDVLEAMPAWPRRPLERRLREVVADGQRLCVVGGAAVSMLVAGLFVAMALSFSPPVHPHRGPAASARTPIRCWDSKPGSACPTCQPTRRPPPC